MSATIDPTIPLPRLVDSLAPLSDALDRASHEERLAWMRSLGARELRALYELAKGTHLSIDDIVPPEHTGVVICEGKNALPAFSLFQKRFARLGDKVVGYNHNTAFTTYFVGPGHYVAYDSPEIPGEVWIDYRNLPPARHPEFPDLAPNDRGLGARLTYGGMVDKLRRVSRHLMIGDAFSGTEKSKNVGFALCLPEGHGV